MLNIKTTSYKLKCLIELSPGSFPPISSSIGELSPGVSALDGSSSNFEEDILKLF